VTFLIDFGIKGAVALGFAFLVAVALRRGSASVRYAMWTCALTAVLVLPVVSSIGPRWSFSRSAWRRATLTASDVAQAAPSVSVVVHARRPAAQGLPMMIWIAGVMAMLARVGFGHWRVRSMFGAAKKIRDSEWVSAAQESAASIGFRRAVVLKLSTATDVPLSYGLIRATVLLPGESEHWTEERRRIVLSHEMIHARRLDSVWGLLAQCALAVNWFNPLAWLAIRQFRKEQERSCDDAVVAAGTASTVYASHLVDLARSIAIPEPALGMAERFDLEGRVHALLDSTRKRAAAGRTFCAAMLAGTMALVIPLAAVHAQAIPKSPSGVASGEVPLKISEEPKPELALSKPLRRPPARERSTVSEEPQVAPRASLAGSVYDPSGAIVPGASISLKNIGAANEEVARASDGGKYQVQNIPVGQYLVRVTAPGFAVYQKTLSLEAGAPAMMDIHLAIGEVKEAVEIAAKRTQSAAAAEVALPRVRVGGMVQPASLISKVNPAYPADARAEGIEGTVLLRAIISKEGNLLHVISVSSGVDPRLVSAAMAAVPLWRYQPAMLNGEPVEVITSIDVTFRLND
jgi:TonB family protein